MLVKSLQHNPPSDGSVSETIYNDDNANLWVKSRQQIDEYNWAEKTTFYDSLGRVYKSRTKDLNGDVETQVKFDNLGRVKATSNPYRVNASGQPAETVFWSKPRYDELNRAVESYAPAAVNPDIATQHGASLGTVEFGISTLPDLIGSYVVAKDASGRKSRSITGIYGIMRVDEATGIGGTTDADLGSLAAPTQPTSYTYNIKGEMIKITQGDQNRYFKYDSLGRLIRVKQPEQTPNPNLATTGNPENNQWTAGYTYNDLGDVVRVTDAKGINIISEFDKAGRSTKICYSKANVSTNALNCNGLTSSQVSDDTQNVIYFYDGKGLPQVPNFSRGALTKVTNTVSENLFTSFDNHGRLLASQQVTDGNAYNFEYKYNISGGLIEEKYPSGRVVKNFLDADGGLSAVSSKTAVGQTKLMASSFDYTAAGAVRKLKLGNGLWETSQLDERFQLKQVGLGTTATNNNLFKIDYEYGELNSNGTTVDTTKNIGMIAKTTTTIPTTSFTQTFKYDAINRLTEAKETGVNNQQNWIQSFEYDRFGNRTSFNQTVGNTTLAANAINKPTINAADNRFTTGQGYVYDFNGNLVQDAEGRTFKFDGNDKQIEVTATNNSTLVIGKYFYDASGARVKKVVGNETTVFVYDAGGALAAEYSTVTPTNPTTSYLTTDHLGSPRVITDKNGNVISRRDFMPFGEEIARLNSGSDAIRKRFTGYEKDLETNLDFAEARMYQNKHGRFTAVDPLMASASPGNPQTFNRYVYTGNNPANYTDPSGLDYYRSANGDLHYFSGSGERSGFTNVTNSYGTITQGGSINGQTVRTGDIIFANSNSLTIIKNPTDAQRALATGKAVVFETVEVSGSLAAELITTDGGNGVGTIFGRALAAPSTASAPQGDDRVDALVGGVNEGLENAQTGVENGGGNIVRDLYNLTVLLATSKNGVPDYNLASQLQVERNSYENARQARFGIATEMIPAIAGGVGGAVRSGGSAVGSVVPQTRVGNLTAIKAGPSELPYASRVGERAIQDPKSHNFPYSFDRSILSTNPILKKDGYRIFQQAGTMNRHEGVFEIGVNKEFLIDHRFFRPNK